jgi:hypothetical protein
MKIAYRSFRNVARVKIFGNCSKKSKLDLRENKSRLNLDSVCYHSVQNLLSSGLLFKKT